MEFTTQTGGNEMTATQTNWNRIEDGYERGNVQILDNGSGLAGSKDSGRWALMVDGKWIANIDTLAEAKQRAEAI